MTTFLFHLSNVQINGHVILDYATVYQQTIDYKFNFLSDIIAVAIDEYCWWHKKNLLNWHFFNAICHAKVQIIRTESQKWPLFGKSTTHFRNQSNYYLRGCSWCEVYEHKSVSQKPAFSLFCVSIMEIFCSAIMCVKLSKLFTYY